MPDQRMSLADAFLVAEQASPMPQVAHQALQALKAQARRWRFWVEAITEANQRLMWFVHSLPFPVDRDSWDLIIDQAIENSGWELGASEPAPHYEDCKHGIHGFDAGIEVGATMHGRTQLRLSESLERAIGETIVEIERAAAKFPTWPTDPLHAAGVVGEEFGELTKAVMQAVYEPHKSGPAEVRAEAIQTAAMALRFLQSINQYVYAPSAQHSQRAVPAATDSGA